ncbi:MAG: TCR/Tet family MFS transporter [Acidobacteriota bacterium]|nr:TCR/Tet family MFS transporter [Acidobacteriota bacterium]MDH3522019.1 TCR/Tet family MFS transporter [Acidobacteriota bacterium]
MSHSRPERPAAMIFILVTLFIDILGIGIIVPVLPELVKHFVGGSTTLAGRYVGVIAASYALMQFLCAPILGALSDRFGRRPILLVALFGLGVDYLIQGLAPTIGWLFVGRLVAGVMGASFTTANAYIADVSKPEDRARNYGLIGVVFGLGFIFGPALGGLLGGIHLRLPFFVSAALALVNWMYGFFILPESLPAEHRSAFSWGKANPWGSIRNLKAYPLVAGLAVSFVFIALAQRGLENVWVLYTGYRFGWDERANGLTLALVGVMAALVQGGLVRPAIARFGERRCVVLGLGVSVLAFLGYGLATRGWMMLAIIVGGSLGGVAGPAIQSLVAGAVGPSDQGKVQGALTSLMSLTSVVAPLVFTAGLFSYFTSERAAFHLPGAPFLLGSLLCLAALAVLLRLFQRMPPVGASQPSEPTAGSQSL